MDCVCHEEDTPEIISDVLVYHTKVSVKYSSDQLKRPQR